MYCITTICDYYCYYNFLLNLFMHAFTLFVYFFHFWPVFEWVVVVRWHVLGWDATTHVSKSKLPLSISKLTKRHKLQVISILLLKCFLCICLACERKHLVGCQCQIPWLAFRSVQELCNFFGHIYRDERKYRNSYLTSIIKFRQYIHVP